MPTEKNYLFGAGHFALSMKHYLEKQGIRFDGIILTKKNIVSYDGIPVFNPNEVSCNSSNCCVYFAVSEKYHFEIEQTLRLYGFKKLIKYSDKELNNQYRNENDLKRILVERYSERLHIKATGAISWNRILVIRLDGIGDMVLSTPFFRELRRRYPNSSITLITSDISYNLFECCPYLDEVVPIDWKKEIVKLSDMSCQLENARKFMYRTFGGRTFDVAVLPRYDTDSYGASYLVFFSGAPCRVAFSENINKEKKSLNKDYDLMFSQTISVSGVCHEVERSMQVLHAMGIDSVDDRLELWTDEMDYQTVKEKLKCNDIIPKETIIAIGLSASHKGRVWPYDKYISLIKSIISDDNGRYKFVLLGGEEERFQAMNIEGGVGNDAIVNLCGKITLRQAFVVMKHAAMYIGHDTGLLHIAATAKCKIVEICATPLNAPKNHPSSTERFGPWKTKCEILRPENGVWNNGWRNANGDFAIGDIDVFDVLSSVKKLWRK